MDLDRLFHLSERGSDPRTELLAGARARGFRIAEVPVTHLAREGGRATGADPRVIAKAFRDLVRYRIRLWRAMRVERGHE